MACFFRYFLTVLALAFCHVSAAAESLFTTPTLRLDPGMHTAPIRRADTDATGQYVVTASHDKTVRIWSGADGRLLDTIPLPIGAGEIGKAYSVAISPDGALIAVGGWTRWSDEDKQDQIYIYDRVARKLIKRIDGLPSVVLHLAFSSDGRRLAATLFGRNGIRLFDAQDDWREIAADGDYGDDSYGVDFARDGRFASTSYDGKLRLYGSKGELRAVQNTTHNRPFGIAFHPDGDRIAVGYDGSKDVDVFASDDLRLLYSVDTAGINNGDLSTLSWSVDGEHLYAGGRFDIDGENPVLVWGDKGQGARKTLSGGQDTLMSILPMPDGDVIVAASDPWLWRIAANGDVAWKKQPIQADFRGQERELLLSRDGTQVGFGYGYGGADPAWFDVGSLALAEGVATELSPPDQDSLKIEDWQDKFNPSLSGVAISLDAYEPSRSLAIAPDGASFVLGTEWSLRAYDSSGELIWRRAAPSVVWGVNISQDGRYIVAAYGDGTIRWHRPEDGAELLAFFPFADKRNWVIWTQDGFHASTPAADQYLKWHTNKGWDQIPDIQAVSAIKGYFAPEIIKLVLQVGDVDRAIDRVRAVERQSAPKPPEETPFEAHLHVLTVGVSRYRDQDHLDLDYADDDAHDLTKHLLNQTGFYNKVQNQGPLIDDQATKRSILSGLRKLKDRMRTDREDVAVISFSGHGTTVDGEYYLLPHDVDASNGEGIEDTGLHIDELIRRVKSISERGKVLVLLDACHSGSVVRGAKQSQPPDITNIQRMLVDAGNGAIVLTSSTKQQISREDEKWENGAFTEAILEALEGKGDSNSDGWISVTELSGYVSERVQNLTNFKQTPRIQSPNDSYFEAKLFQTPLQ